MNRRKDLKLLEKKIRREARRNNLNVEDLTNAVDAIKYQKRDQYHEASIHWMEIKMNTKRLWEVAGDIVQFMSDLGAITDK